MSEGQTSTATAEPGTNAPATGEPPKPPATNGSTTSTSTTGDGKTFTEEEVNELVKERLKREEPKYAELRRKASEFDKLSEAQKTELERAVDTTRRETEEAVRTERDGHWRGILLRSEVRVAAAGKLADPEDAIRFLDLDSLEVDDDGRLDEKKVASAIEKLVEKKPYLAAANGSRRPTDFDAGARTPAKSGEDFSTMIRRQLGKE